MRRKTSRPNSERRSPGRSGHLELFSIPGLPEIVPGDDLAAKIAHATRQSKISFREGDVFVVAQKIISKSEGQLARLSEMAPSRKAQELGLSLDKDPRLIEIILCESRRIVRTDRVLIVETHHGFVCANAGVDHSNIAGDDAVSLLPRDPDASARSLSEALRKQTGKRIAVIISDTFGRPWRLGLTNVAIGAAGVPALIDLRGTRDRNKKPLQATIIAVADELAAAAGLLMGKSTGTPVVVIRGYRYNYSLDPAARIIRPADEDLFR